MDSDKKVNPNPTKSDNKDAVAIREEKKITLALKIINRKLN